MPHKHKRKREDDKLNFDLEPGAQAKPLPAYKPPSVFSNESINKRRKSSTIKGKQKTQDDTPKAFARMMAWQAMGKLPSALDDGTAKPRLSKGKQKSEKPSAQRSDSNGSNKVSGESSNADIVTSIAKQTPAILSGESLAQFALRVDQALPLTSTTKPSSAPNMPTDIKPKARLTKHNKRLQKMISDWRETDAKLKEKQVEQEDDLEEQQDEDSLLWDKVKAANVDRKGKKKNKGKTGTAAAIDDPWKDLEKRRRGETKQKSLQDVVQAPPSLVKIKSKFKMKAEDFHALDGQRKGDLDGDVGVDVRNVPAAIGSLRQREEMGQRRREVIERYRSMNGRKLKGKGLSQPLPRSILTL